MSAVVTEPRQRFFSATATPCFASVVRNLSAHNKTEGAFNRSPSGFNRSSGPALLTARAHAHDFLPLPTCRDADDVRVIQQGASMWLRLPVRLRLSRLRLE